MRNGTRLISISMTISLKKMICVGMIVSIIALIISLVAGLSFHVSQLFTLSIDESAKIILYKVRLPRFLAVYFVGAALAIAGLTLQSALNNALASPSVIGINAGAGFFTLLAALLFPYFLHARMFFGFIGALVSALAVYGISHQAGVSKTTLVLAGLAVSSLMSGFVNAMITFFPATVGDKVAFNLGGFSTVIISQLYFALPVIIIAVVILLKLSRGIDLLLLGDEMATSLGIHVERLRFILVILVALLSGVSVAISGLISFVGLIVPHIVRRLTKANTKVNIVVCGLFGGSFLVYSDLLAKYLFYPYELPVGLLLSVIGAPFFIYLLIHKKRRLKL